MATPEQFREWAERQRPRALTLFFGILRRRGLSERRAAQEAEEAVQEAWATAAEHVGELRSEQGLCAWVVKVAGNIHVSRWRHNRRQQGLPADVAERPEAPLARFLELLRDEIDRLPAEERDLIVKRYQKGRTAAEIAREQIAAGDERSESRVSIVLGERLRAIRARLRRALEQLAGDL